MSTKTNAARILDQLKISYHLQEYVVDEENLSAVHVAENLGISPEKIYKTLVLIGNVTGYLVAVIPADAHVDLKKIAKASHNKHCEMIPMKDLLSVIGYIRGGCSPLGMKKHFPTYIEEMASLEEEILVSAGKRGLQIAIHPNDLQNAVQAEFADLIL